jgi:hypothetical protein
VAEVALSLALVVGLGEALAGKRLVGDLAGGAVGERVVDRRPPGGPFDEPAAAVAGRVGEVLAHAGIPLWVDDNGPQPGVDCPRGDPCLGDGLAGAGGADDQGVPTAIRGAEGDRHGRTCVLASEDHALAAERIAGR